MAYKILLHPTDDRTVRSVQFEGFQPPKVEGAKWIPHFSVVSLFSPTKVEKLFNSPGTYILVGPVADAYGRFPIYVGKSREGGLGKRLRNHMNRGKIHSQAVILHSIEKGGKERNLSQDRASDLEYFIYNKFKEMDGMSINLENTGPIKVRDLQPEVVAAYWKFAEMSIEIVKMLLGVGLDEPVSVARSEKIIKEYKKIWKPKKPRPTVVKRPGHTGGKGKDGHTPPSPTLSDIIKEDDIPEVTVGTKLVSRGEMHLRVAVIHDEEGRIRILKYGKNTKNESWAIDLIGKPPLIYETLNKAKNLVGTEHEVKLNYSALQFWVLASDHTMSLKKIEEKYIKLKQARKESQ